MAEAPAAGRDFLVVGSGPSVLEADPWRIDLDAVIVRVNNFFFEPAYQFGSRVDLLQIGGDRWVFPFYARTVIRLAAAGVYDVRRWSTHQRHVAASARRSFAFAEQRFGYRDAAIEAEVTALARRYGRTPTSGIQAMLNAHAMGAATITLVGLDFYAGETRYGHAVGRHATDLLRQASARGYNERFHSRDLDLAIVDAVQRRGDVRLYRAVEAPPALVELDLAPRRPEAAVLGAPKAMQTKDWDAWAGLYPIGLMKVLRRGREIYKAGAAGRPMPK